MNQKGLIIIILLVCLILSITAFILSVVWYNDTKDNKSTVSDDTKFLNDIVINY